MVARLVAAALHPAGAAAVAGDYYGEAISRMETNLRFETV
jgi:hypothetical protein